MILLYLWIVHFQQEQKRTIMMEKQNRIKIKEKK